MTAPSGASRDGDAAVRGPGRGGASLRRLRTGELIALAGAIAIIVSLFEGWYETPAGSSMRGTPSARVSCCCSWPPVPRSRSWRAP